MSTGSSKAANLHSYMNRTASHATKPFKTGDNSHLCDEKPCDYIAHGQVKKMVEEFQEAEKFANYKRTKENLQKAATKINQRLKETLPRHEYDELLAKKADIAKQTASVEVVLRKMKLSARSNPSRFIIKEGEIRFERTFMEIAKAVLPKDTYDAITDATSRCLEQTKKATP
jgi:hypothetical protein